jgi:hypothetical protein
MRDRLIELIGNKPFTSEYENYNSVEWAEHFADYLLENGVIVPPYEIGAKVYVPINSLSLPIPNAIYECEIQRYGLVAGGLVPIIKVKKGSVTYGDIQTSLDKLYASKEKAVQALKGGVQE